MKLIPDWLRSAIDDGTGNVSSSRLAFLSVVFVTIILPGLLWFWLSGLASKLLEIPGSVTGFAGASAAAVVGLFGINKRSE